MSDSDRPTAPPSAEAAEAAIATRQMAPFQLAVALAKLETADDAPPSLLVGRSALKTPIVELTRSDVEELEASSVDLGWDTDSPAEE